MTTSTIVRDSERADDPRAKSFLRQQLLAARRQLSTVQKVAAETMLCQRLQSWLQAHPVSSLGVYHPIRLEPDLQPLYNALSTAGVDQALDFVRWTPGEPLVKDAMGTSVPASAIAAQPQALLIPCLGFNAARIRLGYGGGFYDRTLAQQPRPLAIGVAYTDALREFNGEAHDIPLDLIITGP
jgi:5-formyltetrahydrofolate cyclo-ligase